jgi:acyl transferase domain-containing protein
VVRRRDDRRDAASGGTGRLVTLPTYPFQRARHWREPENAPPPDPAPPALRARVPRRAARPGAAAGHAPSAHRVRPRRRLRAGGRRPSRRARRCDRRGRVRRGVRTPRPRRYCIRPESREDWAAVLGEVVTEGVAPQVLHFGSVTGPGGAHGTAEAFNEALPAGFFSLCAIAQAAHDRGIVSGST